MKYSNLRIHFLVYLISINEIHSLRMLSICLSNQYDDGVQCKLCHPTCQTCTAGTSSDCTQCDATQFFEQFPSSSLPPFSCSCMTGYFLGASQTCQPCDQSCERCSGSGSNNCLSCKSSSLRNLNGGFECVCGSGYFDLGDKSTCQQCNTACAECLTSATNCLTCADVLKSPSSSSCSSCVNPQFSYSANCLACVDPLKEYSTSCSTCIDTNRQITSGSCVCKDGFYEDSSSVCQACLNDCIQCNDSLTCNTCMNNQVFSGTMCKCLDGTYLDSNSVCQPCDASCLTCNGASMNDCVTCGAHSSINTSVCQCDSHYFYDASKICQQCDSTCLECADGTLNDCTSCDAANKRISSSGSTTFACICMTHYYESSSGACTQCDQTCGDCSGGSQNECTTCDTGSNRIQIFGYSPSQCQCKSHYYQEASGNCSVCDKTCVECLDNQGNSCNSCDSSAFRIAKGGFPNECVCIPGYYEDSNRDCQPCHPTCQICLGGSSTQCMTCSPAQFRESDSGGSPPFSCICISHYYQDAGGSCSICDKTCVECLGNQVNNCNSCDSSAQRVAKGGFPNECVCIPGYYEDSNRDCQPCHPTCPTCSGGTATQCMTCSPAQFRESDSGGSPPFSCICISHYYQDAGGSCSICDKTCVECGGSSVSTCNSCDSSAFRVPKNIFPSECVCMPGYYEDSNRDCVPCNPSCATCSGGSQTQCTSCNLVSFREPSTASTIFSCKCISSYFEDSVGNCSLCDKTCSECQDNSVSSCSSCDSSVFRIAKHAFPSECECENGYYEDSNRDCKPCDLTCTTCSGGTSNQCTSCSIGQFRQPDPTVNSSFSCVCISHYYPVTGGNCSACDKTCIDCVDSSSQKCNSCDSSAFRVAKGGFPSECVCMTGYYEDFNRDCQPCHSTCPTCLGGSSTECTSCSLATFRQRDSSMNPMFSCNCISHYYQDTGGSCSICDKTCLECTNNQLLNCSSCDSLIFRVAKGVFPSECVCMPGYYEDSNRDCQPCHPTCLTCLGGSSTQCTTCSSAQNRQQDSTMSTSFSCICISHFYQDAGGSCSICDKTCVECRGSSVSTCESCDSSAFRTPKNAFPSECECLPGYYEDSNRDCQPCNPTCATCSGGSSTQCISCSLVQFRQQDSTGNLPFSCICISHYYQDTFGNCVSCDHSCLDCSSLGPLSCSSCDPTAHRVSNSLVPPFSCLCSSHYFPDSQNDCQLCDDTCLECTGSTLSECTSCQPLRNLISNSCPCITSYFSDIHNVCQQCDPTCLNCQSGLPTDCTACDSSLHRSPSSLPNPTFQCTCTQGYFLDLGTNTCQVCFPTCQECISASNIDCTACDSALFFIAQPEISNYSCICQPGYFLNSSYVCIPCASQCLTCSGPNDNECLTCKLHSTFNLSTHQCPCDSTFFFDSSAGQCQACDYSCLECTGASPSQCSSCDPAVLRTASPLTPPFSCVCMPQTFFDTGSQSCLPCHYSCSSCNGITANQCLTCQSNRTISALNSCPCNSHYFEDSLNNLSCAICDSTCLECIGNSTTDCSSCSSSLLRTPNPPLSSSPFSCICSDGYYQDSSGLCSPCNYSCSKCFGGTASSCQACTANRLFDSINFQCPCLVGYFEDSMSSYSCRLCHTSCLTCITNNSSLTCTSCDSTSPIFRTPSSSSSAIFSCPCLTGYYEDSSFNCQPCHPTCLTCSGSANTQCITCKSHSTLSATNTCICNPGYYLNTSNSCALCKASCLTCSGSSASKCTSCDSSSPSFRQAPVGDPSPFPCQCIPGYFENTLKACIQCDKTCLTCTNGTSADCSSCSSTNFRINKLNLPSPFSCPCMSTYFEDSSQNCQKCDQSCLECTGPLTTSCASCGTDRYLSGLSQCLCNPGLFENTSLLCQACDQSCQQCSGAATNQCTLCDSTSPKFRTPRVTGFSQFFCDCLPRYYEDPSSKKCLPCHHSCLTCSGPNDTDCIICEAHRIKTSSKCPCIIGYFEDTSNLNTCSICNHTCLSCNGFTDSSCTSCDSTSPSFRTPSQSLPPFSCVCLSHYYEDTTPPSTCKICDYTCGECSAGTSSDCKTCLSSSFRLTVPSTVPSHFTCPCQSHYFSDGINNLCKKCHYSCSECAGSTASTSCTQCNIAKHRIPDTSTNECKCQPTFFDDLSNEYCNQCDITCLTCSDLTPTGCLSCDPSKNFIPSPIVPPSLTFSCMCSAHTYYNPSTNSCLACYPTCNSCTGPLETNCSSCYSIQNRVYKASITSCICQQMTFSQNKDYSCQPCDPSCFSCVGPSASQCTTCPSSSFRTLNSLYNLCTCTDGYYFNTLSNSCSPCSSSCLTCLSSPTYCISCSSKLTLLSDNTCGCLTHQYYNAATQSCLPCDQSCLSCSSSASTDCLSCNSGYSSSVPTPPYPCILDSSIASSLCHPTCLTCSNINHQVCLTCPVNFQLSSNGIVLFNGQSQQHCTCISGYYFRQSTFSCQPCHYSCLSCIGPFTNHCLTCSGNRIIKSPSSFLVTTISQCVCPSGTFDIFNQPICLPCQSPCVECAGSAYFCTLCKPQFQLGGGNCFCKPGYIYASAVNECLLCDVSCLNCDGNTANDCISCASITRSLQPLQMSSAIQTGTCLCNEGYADIGLAACKPCNPSCKLCTQYPNKCTECYPQSQSFREFNPVNHSCDCIIRYYENNNQQCDICPYDCLRCDSNNNCLLCDTAIRTLTADNRCECNIGSFEKDLECIQCDPSCNTCEGTSTECITCFPGQTLSNQSQCECDEGSFYSYGQNGSTQHCMLCMEICQKCTNDNTCSTCDNSNFFTLNTTSNHCQCYYGRELFRNSTGQMNCLETLYYTVNRQNFWYFNGVKFLQMIVSGLILLSIFFGSPTVPQTAFAFIFDLLLILLSNMQKPDVIKDILQDIYDYSLMRLLTNVTNKPSSSEQVSYFSDYFKAQRISSFIESGMFCLSFLIAIQLAALLLKLRIYSPKTLNINSIYQATQRRIFLNRLYHLHFFNIYFSVIDIIHYFLLMMSVITLYTETNTINQILSWVFLSYVVMFSYQNIKKSNEFFQDKSGILDRPYQQKHNLRIQHQAVSSYVFLNGIGYFCLALTSQLTYPAIILTIRLSMLLPASILQFKGQKIYQIGCVICHLFFSGAVLFLFLATTNSEIRYMTDDIMDKIVIYSIVFEGFAIIFLLTIAIALIADIGKNLYNLKNQRIDYSMILETVQDRIGCLQNSTKHTKGTENEFSSYSSMLADIQMNTSKKKNNYLRFMVATPPSLKNALQIKSKSFVIK